MDESFRSKVPGPTSGGLLYIPARWGDGWVIVIWFAAAYLVMDFRSWSWDIQDEQYYQRHIIFNVISESISASTSARFKKKTFKQVAKGSTPQKNTAKLTPTISHQTIFPPLKNTKPPTTTAHRTWPYQLGLVRKGHGLCHPCFGHFKFGTKLFTDARGTWRVTTKEGSLVSLKQPRVVEMVGHPPWN